MTPSAFVRRILAVAALVGLAACATGPDQPELDFFTRVVYGFPRLEPEAKVRDGHVQVTGLLVTRHTGYTLRAELNAPSPRTLVVTLFATQTAEGVFVPTQNYYAATVKQLPRGDYDVSLIYLVDADARDSSFILRRTLSIP